MDLLEKFGPLLGQVAPTIATALGGPLAGVAVKTLSNAIFGHEDATEQQISDAMASATPDQLAAIKKIDADFKVPHSAEFMEAVVAGAVVLGRMRTARGWPPALARGLAQFLVVTQTKKKFKKLI